MMKKKKKDMRNSSNFLFRHHHHLYLPYLTLITTIMTLLQPTLTLENACFHIPLLVKKIIMLDLSLSIGPPGPSSSRFTSTDDKRSLSHSPSPSPSPSPNPVCQMMSTGSAVYQPRVRKNPFQTPKRGKSEAITAPYQWATTRRATVYNLDHLLSHGVHMIDQWGC
ncbi:hypothetical protein CRYUN_Cryun09bG0024800 [Craigia yunnanensis]